MTGRAVFVSVANYESSGFRSYPTIESSAAKLRELFSRSSRWDEPVHVRDPADQAEFMRSIAPTLDACGPDDSLLVYFCGHGEAVRRGDQFAELRLALSSSEPKAEVSQLDRHVLYNAMRRCRAATKVLILDCCESADVPVLPESKDGSGSRTCVLTALRPGERLASATWAGDGEYTAFSGALIDVVTSGVPEAGRDLDIADVCGTLEDRLGVAGHPTPKPVHGGVRPLPLIENVACGDGWFDGHLADKSAQEVAELWTAGSDRGDAPLLVLEQRMRAWIAEEGRDVAGLVHHLHGAVGGSAARRQEALDIITSGPVHVFGRAVRSLAESGCSACDESVARLLERAAEELRAQHIPDFYRQLDAARREQLEIVLASRTSAEGVRAVADRLPERLGRDTAADAVDRLFRLFADLREGSCVRALLGSLRADGKEYDAETVLQHMTLDLSPVDVAEFARQLVGAEQDAQQVREKVVRNRSSWDVAVFVDAFGTGAGAQMREVLSVAAEQRSSLDEMVRLARALRGCGLADAPSEVVNVALRHEFSPEQVNELVDRLTAAGSEQRAAITAVLREHLKRSTVAPEHLARYLRGPSGEAESLVHDVVAARRVGRVIELHEQVRDDARLSEEIARSVAACHEASDLLEFLKASGVDEDVTQRMLVEVGDCRNGRTIGEVLLNWQESTRSGRRFPRDQVHDLLAPRMSSDVLLQARGRLGRSNRAALLDPVVCKAFERPQRFSVHEVVELLADVWEQPGRRTSALRECVDVLIRRVEQEGPSTWVGYLAELVVTAFRRSGRGKLFDIVFNDGFRVVNSHDDAMLNYDYVTALRTCGADELADEVKRKVDAWPGPAAGGP